MLRDRAKNPLRDVMGQMGIAVGSSDGCGVGQSDVPSDKGSKGFIAGGFGILAQQFGFIGHDFTKLISAERTNRT